MIEPTIHQQAADLLTQTGALLAPGQEIPLRGPQLAHCPIFDTALAACLAVLDIPFREPAPFTDHAALDEGGNEKHRRKCWWMADISRTGDDETRHKTEELCAAWEQRARFEADPEFQSHPLTIMRRAIDARLFWIDVLKHRRPLPSSAGLGFATDSLREASVLLGMGYQALAFNGRVFVLAPELNFVPADRVLANSHSLEMTSPEQWMRRVLHVQEEMLKVAKRAPVIIAQDFDDRTLLLTDDATRKTAEKFHAQL